MCFICIGATTMKRMLILIISLCSAGLNTAAADSSEPKPSTNWEQFLGRHDAHLPRGAGCLG